MGLPSVVAFRLFEPSDVAPAYAVFRRSLFDYLLRIGLVDAATASDPPIESAWASQGPWVEHLVGTAAENWVATDDAGRVVGWAMSTERDGVLELTHYFVEPGLQARGVGRRLLELAFPIGRGRHRVIMATQDTRALSLYLRFGVRYVTTSVDLFRSPEPVEIASDLAFDRLDNDDVAVNAVAALEQAVLGHRRDLDIRFLLGIRPGWIASRGGTPVGFAFGARGPNSGPIAALDPADLPAMLDLVERDASATGVEDLYFSVPLVNSIAVEHLLGRGFRIDPFYVNVLADEPTMHLDRWVHTGPSFIV
jgi:GNAT superfamily N-acetyltransferase